MKGRIADSVNTYDAVFSLGCRCGAALYMKRNDLRLCSGPFDWVMETDTLSARVETLENRFAHWMDPEDLEITSDVARFHFVKNLRTGYRFLHDFPAHMPIEESLPRAQAKYRRRQERFFETIRTQDRILLFWFNPFGATPEERLPELYRRLCGTLGKQVDLLMIEDDRMLDRTSVVRKTVCPGMFLFRTRLTEVPEGRIVLGDWPKKVDRILGGFRLREDLRRKVRSHRIHARIKFELRHLLASLCPFRSIRRKIRGQDRPL